MLCAGKSDVGLIRRGNEDAFVTAPEQEFCVVADGMGGAEAGELASQLFVQAALEVFSTADRASLRDTAACVEKAFAAAHQEMLRHVEQHPRHKGMGCTAELLAFSPDGFVLGHMGDSRTYRFRHGALRMLTRDHSLVQSQVEQGLITPEEARKHPMRHVILRAVGIGDSPALDLVTGTCSPGDIFLLCSDGLTDMVEDSRIRELLATEEPLPRIAELLVAAALSAGGSDNVTAVLCERVR